MKFNLTAGNHTAVADFNTDKAGKVSGSIEIPGLGSAMVAGNTSDGRELIGEVKFGHSSGKFSATIDGARISGKLWDLPFPASLVVPGTFSGQLVA